MACCESCERGGPCGPTCNAKRPSSGKPCCDNCARTGGSCGGGGQDHDHDHDHDHEVTVVVAAPDGVGVIAASGTAAPLTGQVLDGSMRASAQARVPAPTGLPAAVRASGAAGGSSVLQQPWVIPVIGATGLAAAGAIAYLALRGRGAPTTCREAAKALGVAATATPAQIRSAHKARALASHPDRGGSTQEMARVNTARDILLSSTCAR